MDLEEKLPVQRKFTAI